MWQSIKTLDRILRGQATQIEQLRDDRFDAPVPGLTLMIALLGIIYGLCMGLFSITPGGSGHAMQIVASMAKVPILFLATFIVTFPSLYVFNALVGSQLLALTTLRLLIASLAVMLAVLASIGPIVAFFSFTTTSYDFMVLLNVLVFTIAGFLGLGFLLQTLQRMTIAKTQRAFATSVSPDPATPDPAPSVPAPTSPLDAATMHFLTPRVKTVFRVWLVVFGLVGCQMAWVLRPFIGHPDRPFTWFRHPYSNFFEAVIHSARAPLFN
jgi:hypothetical protein